MENINEEEISLDESVKEKEWEVEKILRVRQRLKRNKKTKKTEKVNEFLVKWKGYKKATWEPEENLENCQVLLLDFYQKHNLPKAKRQPKTIKSYQIYAKQKQKQRIIPNTPILRNKKRWKNREIQIEDPSTFSNSYANNLRMHFKKKEPNEISIVEDKNEEPNMLYDIEIVDDKANDEIKTTNQSKVKKKIVDKKEPKVFQITEVEEENKNMNYDVYNEGPTNLDKYEHSIYLDQEDNDNDIQVQENYEEAPKKNENKSKVIKYLEKKIRKDNIFDNGGNMSVRSDENDNKFKVIGIYGMKVPQDSERGILVSIKYKKNNKIYLEEFNTKLEEVPSDYLSKYYEMFICENFKGRTYSQELCFD